MCGKALLCVFISAFMLAGCSTPNKQEYPAMSGTAATDYALIESITRLNPPAAGLQDADPTAYDKQTLSHANHMYEQFITMQQVAYGTDIRVTRTHDDQIILKAPFDTSFQSKSDQLSQGFARVLEHLATTLNRNTKTKIRIAARTKDAEDQPDHFQLCSERTRNVANHLTKFGVLPSRIAVEKVTPVSKVASEESLITNNHHIEILISQLSEP